MRGVSHELAPLHPGAREKSCAKNLLRYTDNCGSHVRSGRRQSMPSISMYRQQLDPRLLFPKSSSQVKSPPAEHLIGVYPVCPRYSRYRRARRQGLFHDSPLLGDASLLPSDYNARFSIFGNDCGLLRSVHLRSKWTLIRSVHLASI